MCTDITFWMQNPSIMVLLLLPTYRIWVLSHCWLYLFVTGNLFLPLFFFHCIFRAKCSLLWCFALQFPEMTCQSSCLASSVTSFSLDFHLMNPQFLWVCSAATAAITAHAHYPVCLRFIPNKPLLLLLEAWNASLPVWQRNFSMEDLFDTANTASFMNLV